MALNVKSFSCASASIATVVLIFYMLMLILNWKTTYSVIHACRVNNAHIFAQEDFDQRIEYIFMSRQTP